MATLLLLAVASSACQRSQPERVVLISIDTLRADHVGCYGGARAHTPALDALAASGIRFTRAFSPAPLTLPAHTTLMTGLDPPEHGVRHNSVFRLGEEIPTLGESFQSAGFATAAFVGAFVLDRQFGLARGFDHYDDQMAPRGPESGAVGYAERSATQVIDAALEWLSSAPPRFFLWIHMYDPHARYMPPPGFAAAFAQSPYDGEIAYADSQVRRLLEAVDAKHPDAKTLVAVTSDHGESLGEHGEATHSHTIYDATQRIPLILAGPGVPASTTPDVVVSLRDVGPTLLDLAGLESLSGATGRSLREALDGRAIEERPAYSETLATQLDMEWSPLLSVRTQHHRYIRAPRPELYELSADPDERQNIHDREPAVVEALDAEVSRRIENSRDEVSTLRVTAEERRRLEGLGYIVPEPGPSERPLGVVGGPDPKDHLDDMAHIHRAARLVGERRWEEALESLRSAEDPGTTGLMLRATASLALGDHAAAERAAREVIQRKPLHASGYIRLAHALEVQHKLDAATTTWKRVAELDPAAPEPSIGFGRIAELRGDRATARSHYETASSSRVPNAESFWRLAALEIENQESESAARLLAEVPEGRLTEVSTAIRLAQAHRKVGEFDAALERLRAVPDENRTLPLYFLVYAEIQEKRGAYDEALAYREEALKRDPGDPRAQNDLAWSLADHGRDLPRAETLVRRAIERVGRIPHLLDTLATVELSQGRFRNALRTIEEARRGAPAELTPHLDLLEARARAELGDSERAEELIRSLAARAAELPGVSLDEAEKLAGQLGVQWPRQAP